MSLARPEIRSVRRAYGVSLATNCTSPRTTPRSDGLRAVEGEQRLGQTLDNLPALAADAALPDREPVG